VILRLRRSSIVPSGQLYFAAVPQSDIIFAIKLRAAQYHAAQAEYKNLPCGQNLVIRFAHNNCNAIKLAAGEYN